MHPSELSIRDYQYSLPESKIASYPLPERDASRLLIYQHGSITEDRYRNLAAHLPGNAWLIFNNTRVVEARILFQKSTGGVIEIFCLEPAGTFTGLATAMLQTSPVRWKCLIGGASKWKPGEVLEKKLNTAATPYTLRAAIRERLKDCFVIEFEWDHPHHSFAEVLHDAGLIPLPPYIRRAVDENDRKRYQTVYAKEEGSVAAPTAGLHFTPAIFEALSKKNIDTGWLTLHVGAGTFKPVKSATMGAHDMHTEFMEAGLNLIEKLAGLDRIIFCVGTTSLRCLESLYWMGRKILRNPEIDSSQLPITQWEVYDDFDEKPVPAKTSFWALANWMRKRSLEKLFSHTSILIAPGYRARVAQGLITNFHQPQSTLLLLVAALIGEDWRKVYNYALQHDFRFLSYGDGCLLEFGNGERQDPENA